MSDTTEATGLTQEGALHGTFGYTRKITDGNYGATEATLFLPFVVNPDDPDANVAALKAAVDEAKATVLNELGIPFEMDAQGDIREKAQPVLAAPAPSPLAAVAAAFPGAEQVQTQPTGATASGGGYKVLKHLTDENGVKVPLPPWFEQQRDAAIAAGKGTFVEVYDNREGLPKFGGTKNPRLPWFKDKNGDKGGIWPPKGSPDAS